MIRRLLLVVVALAGSIVQGSAQGVTPRPTFAQMSIPEPGWAWDTTVAAEYGSADYVTHYFDNTGTCTDTANANGSIASPRCTPPTMTSLAAGSVVQGCGTYSRGTSDITVTASGTSADPVFFQARNATDCPGGLVFTFSGSGNMVFGGSSYLIVKGMSWTAVEGMTCSTCDHFSLLDNNISGTNDIGDSGGMVAVSSSTDVVRARNIIHDGGDWTSGTENDTHCLALGSGITRLWDVYNTTYHCAGDGQGNAHDANHTTTDVYIGGNEMYENRENCIDLKEVDRIIISRNWCHDITSSSSSAGEGIVLHYGPTTGEGPYQAWILNNLIEDVVSGVAFSDVESPAGEWQVVVGNVIRSCSGVGITHDSSSSTGVPFHFKHNTIANCPSGIVIGSAVGSASVGGNIVREASARHFATDTSGIRDVTDVSNELYYDADGGLQIGWGSTGTTYTDFATAIAGTADWDGSIQSDPLFTNFAGGGYTLQSGSPAINAGVDMSTVEDEFQAAFGASLLIDIAGTARPDGVWDIGAYEYADVAPPPEPGRAPGRLRIRMH